MEKSMGSLKVILPTLHPALQSRLIDEALGLMQMSRGTPWPIIYTLPDPLPNASDSTFLVTLTRPADFFKSSADTLMDARSCGVDRLTTLPVEVLDIILDFIMYNSGERPKRHLLGTSLVNRQIRALCLPKIFRTFRLSFDSLSYSKLLNIALSPHLARCLREVIYFPPLFYSQELSSRKKFERFFSKTKFRRSLQDPLCEKAFSVLGRTYKPFQATMTRKYKEQSTFVANGFDRAGLSLALRLLPNLSSLHLLSDSKDELMNDSDLWIDVMDDPCAGASEHHSNVCVQALDLARRNGVHVRSFQSAGQPLPHPTETLSSEENPGLSAFSNVSLLRIHYHVNCYCYYNQDWQDELPGFGYRSILQSAAATLTTLSINPSFNSPSGADTVCFNTFCPGMYFPVLKDLYLYSLGLRVEGMEDFVSKCAPTLSTLNFEDVWFRFGEHSEFEAPHDLLIHHLQCYERVGIAAKALTDTPCYDERFIDRDEKDEWKPVRTFERLLKREIGWEEAQSLVKLKTCPLL